MTQYSICEIMWIHQLLKEVGRMRSTPATLWCNNQASLHIALNPIFHEQTKHIEIDYHFVRKKIQQGLISTGYVKTGEQLGDIFTEALNGTTWLTLDIYAPLEGEFFSYILNH